eukprot:7569578-Heterocapsa_arctica.AAC.1
MVARAKESVRMAKGRSTYVEEGRATTLAEETMRRATEKAARKEEARTTTPTRTRHKRHRRISSFATRMGAPEYADRLCPRITTNSTIAAAGARTVWATTIDDATKPSPREQPDYLTTWTLS